MWKLGLRPLYSFYGDICFEISVFCLCSACTVYTVCTVQLLNLFLKNYEMIYYVPFLGLRLSIPRVEVASDDGVHCCVAAGVRPF